MCERICANCACAVRAVGRWHRVIMSRWPGLLMCMNHPEAPGQLHEVAAHHTCRNFRARPKPAVRAEPPEAPNDEIRYIPLTKSKFAIVDKADYEWLSQYKWQAAHTGTKFYATMKKGRGGNIWMHRLIMNAPEGMVVDHINGNGLDNYCPQDRKPAFRPENRVSTSISQIVIVQQASLIASRYVCFVKALVKAKRISDITRPLS